MYRFHRISEDRLNELLPRRLQGLDSFVPPAGGWSRLDARLTARRRLRLAAGSSLALAASVFVAIGLAGLRPDLVAPRPGAAPNPEVAHLITRSQALERELSSARPQAAVWTSGRETRAAVLEQRLRLVDQQLNFADGSDAERLWRDRVSLMNALVELHEPQAPALQYASYEY